MELKLTAPLKSVATLRSET